MRDAPLALVMTVMSGVADATMDFMLHDPANADAHCATAPRGWVMHVSRVCRDANLRLIDVVRLQPRNLRQITTSKRASASRTFAAPRSTVSVPSMRMSGASGTS